ncbi:hypothetical protein EUX98_g8665 [Antrodiella citrinella]|uniref:Uncharacterized protein n=1 Tax=Antrodiella citrinella TaxID=2447956 RepID=A0A4S4M6A9_9APHY|nr:hypothetical protein EUX98_g8665 [Antrodiella citrinella]
MFEYLGLPLRLLPKCPYVRPLSPLSFLSTLTDVDTGYLTDNERNVNPQDAEAAQILRAFSQDRFMYRDELAQFINSGNFWHQGDFVIPEADSVTTKCNEGGQV